MTVTTKYSVGDDVWVLYNNKIRCYKVIFITTETYFKDGKLITSCFIKAGVPSRIGKNDIQTYTGILTLEENQFFPTKQILLESL